MFVSPEGVLCLAAQSRFHDEKTASLAGHFSREKQRYINRPVVPAELKDSAGYRNN